ncbi:IS5 family transposase [Picosynechococcus sp. PCC 11901]|uniref:IS5 family transposase n=1 Tax=Picosynechococcus sp. PCC 11901 TaxID=2579791 RepID=UPI0010FBD967|nr:IS5 family transposase [Picosynechococcus sp. PCC 11901]QCS47990.1 IS5 family transposase [Picosynechococcus sp. PCC 11901]QCS48121.1 IS5 family transposase [Picosynechococcus sp. PCC 11901]QCS48237.1 IS5 family transposase [Picosynechococcus sp. PCC 11901]QCS48269.1 IS5 family transposase [Picosynechococcus sp. PCC 11901]QCS48677.1 IS5 family transposase [Picosynechococcus sp. PCC 11901]
MSQLGFWDWEKRHQYLEEKQDILVKLNEWIPWEEFREILNQVQPKERKSKAGRKAIDPVRMFKLLILQRLYGISDEALEYQVNDRLSFMKFVGLGIEDKVPDATTVWLFRQKLVEQKLAAALFEKFEGYLQKQGYQAEEGQIIDATLIPVPRQRNRREENEVVKSGKIPEDWKDKPRKKRQKDCDARWTKKNQENHFGYKNHINVDVKYKLIRKYAVTAASVHDSQMFAAVLDGSNRGDGIWADSAYQIQVRERVLALMGMDSHIHEKGNRNHPLSETQKARNKERSHVRSRVEHIFGTFVTSMGGKMERVIGHARIETQIALKNLAYNFRRYVYLQQSCA